METAENNHVAGIIPVAGQPDNFQFEWHDCLMPLAQNYTALERAVVECAYAGCKTIWIVCNDDTTPLVRYRIGDWVEDPVWIGRKYKFPSQERKQIPIFYVPIHPKDRDRRDCLAWSIIYGALQAFRVNATISRWVIPKHYYVAFPYGVYDPKFLREHRADIGRGEFFLSHGGRTVREGEYVGFTFGVEDFIRYRRVIRTGTGKLTPGSTHLDKEILPFEERWSARHFTLDKVFKSATIEESNVVDLPWYYNIDSWEKYREFLGSEQELKHPGRLIMSYHEFNPIGGTSDQETRD